MGLLETTTTNEMSTPAGDMGNLVGKNTTDKIGFYGKDPIVQRASANQAAVPSTAATNSTPYGYSQAQADAIVARLNEVIATLTALGVWKGGA